MGRINLARTLRRSAANGPGERYVVWVQGCHLTCPGCWNADTWSFARRDLWTVDDLVADILSTPGLDGVTLTGGEPMEQARALTEVARRVRAEGLSVFIFTGYQLEQLSDPAQEALLALTDVVVSGRYEHDLRVDDLPWRGSSNQQVHFVTKRYGPAELAVAPSVEVRIEANGTVVATGFPVGWGEIRAGVGL